MQKTKNAVVSVATNHLIWPLLILACVLGSAQQGFLRPQNLLNIVWSAAPVGMMTLALFFVMIIGRLDLSIESTFAVAPVIAVVLITNSALSLPPAWGILITVFVGLLVGYINGILTVKLGINAFLVTLATLLTLRGVVIYLIPSGIYNLPRELTFLGGARVLGVPVAIVFFVLFYFLAYVLMEYTSTGKNLYAIGSNERAAFVSGIDVSKINVFAFVIAGFFASLGGLIELGRLDSVVADMGEGSILMVFAAATLGGTSLQGGEGRVSGIFASSLVIAVVDNVMNLIGVDPAIRQIVFGLILLGAIYLASLQSRMKEYLEKALAS